MRQEKITVAPRFVFFVCFRAERPAGVARRAVPMQDVLVVGIVRSEVEAAAEPPMSGPGAGSRQQEPDIAVCGRGMRILRMKYQRQTHGLERRPGDFRTDAG